MTYLSPDANKDRFTYSDGAGTTVEITRFTRKILKIIMCLLRVEDYKVNFEVLILEGRFVIPIHASLRVGLCFHIKCHGIDSRSGNN